MFFFFENCIAIFLVIPGKPSSRHLDSMSTYSIGRTLEETSRCEQVIKTHRRRFKGLVFSAQLISSAGYGQQFTRPDSSRSSSTKVNAIGKPQKALDMSPMSTSPSCCKIQLMFRPISQAMFYLNGMFRIIVEEQS